jgi:hypothetical protein
MLFHPPYSPDLVPADFSLYERCKHCAEAGKEYNEWLLTYSVALVLKQTIPTERPPTLSDGINKKF